VPARSIAGGVAAELRALAGWLELETIEVADNGTSPLRSARPARKLTL
jgi:uncharacterized protein YcaQ